MRRAEVDDVVEDAVEFGLILGVEDAREAVVGNRRVVAAVVGAAHLVDRIAGLRPGGGAGDVRTALRGDGRPGLGERVEGGALFAVGLHDERGVGGGRAGVVVGHEHRRRGERGGVVRIGAGHVFLPVRPAVEVGIAFGVVGVGVETVLGLPVVGHAVAVIEELAPGEGGAVVAGEVVGVAVAVGVEGARICSGHVFGPVVKAVRVEVAVGAVLAGGVVGVEAVCDLPPVREAVAVGIDGRHVPAGAEVVPERDIDVRHRAAERQHVGEQRDALVEAELVQGTAEVVGIALGGAPGGGEIDLPVGVHRVGNLRGVDLRRGGGERLRKTALGERHRVEHPRRGVGAAVAPELVGARIPDRPVERQVDRRALRQVRRGVLDEGHVCGRIWIGRVGSRDNRGDETAPPRDVGRRADARDGVEALRLHRRVGGRKRELAGAAVHGVGKVVEGVVVEQLLRELGERVRGGEVLPVPDAAGLVHGEDLLASEAAVAGVGDLGSGAGAVPDPDLVDPALEVAIRIEVRAAERGEARKAPRIHVNVGGDHAPRVAVGGAEDDRRGAVAGDEHVRDGHLEQSRVAGQVLRVGRGVLADAPVGAEERAGAGLEGADGGGGEAAVHVAGELARIGIHDHGHVIPAVGRNGGGDADRDARGGGAGLAGVVVNRGHERAVRVELGEERVANLPAGVGADAGGIDGHPDRTIEERLRVAGGGVDGAEPELGRVGGERPLVVGERVAGARGGGAVEVEGLAAHRAVGVERIGAAAGDLLAVGHVVVVGVVALVRLKGEEVGRGVEQRRGGRVVPGPEGAQGAGGVVEAGEGERIARVGDPIRRGIRVVQHGRRHLVHRLLEVRDAVLIRVREGIAGEPRAGEQVVGLGLGLVEAGAGAEDRRLAADRRGGDSARAGHGRKDADGGRILGHEPVLDAGSISEGLARRRCGFVRMRARALHDVAVAVERVEAVEDLPRVRHRVVVRVGVAGVGAREAGRPDEVGGDVGVVADGLVGGEETEPGRLEGGEPDRVDRAVGVLGHGRELILAGENGVPRRGGAPVGELLERDRRDEAGYGRLVRRREGEEARVGEERPGALEEADVIGIV